MGCVVTSKGGYFTAESSRLDVFQQRSQDILLVTWQDKVIAFFEERDKVKVELQCSGLQPQRGVGLSAGDETGTFGMRVDNALVAIYRLGREVQAFQFSI